MGFWVKRLMVAVAAAASLAVAGCGKAPSDEPKVLHLYNWSDYIDPKILTDFTAETGIKVVYDTYDSNEILETKVLQGQTGYDIVVPSKHNIPRYITAQALTPLDKSQLKNLGNLWPKIMAHMDPFDPGARYTIPYMWGTVGIGYNPEALAKRLPGVNIDSWAMAFDPKILAKLQDCRVYWLDASEDMFAVALNYMGRDPNSKSVADYKAAADMMSAARPYVRKFHSSQYIDALANGDICLAVGYSGDILQAKDRAEEAGGKVKVAYAIPKEGTQIWFDVFALPKDAPSTGAAYTFLDYMLRPDVIARASNFTKYANANSASTSLVEASVRDDPNVYPTDEVFKRLFVTTGKDEALLREVNRQWVRVQTGQ